MKKQEGFLDSSDGKNKLHCDQMASGSGIPERVGTAGPRHE